MSKGTVTQAGDGLSVHLNEPVMVKHKAADINKVRQNSLLFHLFELCPLHFFVIGNLVHFS